MSGPESSTYSSLAVSISLKIWEVIRRHPLHRSEGRGVAGRIAAELLLPKVIAFLGDLAFGMPKEQEEIIRKVLANVALEVATERQLSDWAFDGYLNALSGSSSELVNVFKPDDEELYLGLFRTNCDFLASLYERLEPEEAV